MSPMEALLIAIGLVAAVLVLAYMFPSIDRVLRKHEDAALEWLSSAKGKRFLRNGGYAIIFWVATLIILFEWRMDYQGYESLIHSHITLFSKY